MAETTEIPSTGLYGLPDGDNIAQRQRPHLVVQTLVEAQPEDHGLEAWWPYHAFDGLVEAIPESDNLQGLWEFHLLDWLVERIAKLQYPQPTWPRDVLQTAAAVLEAAVKNEVDLLSIH